MFWHSELPQIDYTFQKYFNMPVSGSFYRIKMQMRFESLQNFYTSENCDSTKSACIATEVCNYLFMRNIFLGLRVQDSST